MSPPLDLGLERFWGERVRSGAGGPQTGLRLPTSVGTGAEGAAAG